MGKHYVTSSFSLQMLPKGGVVEITPTTAITKEWADEWRIGHQGTADALSSARGWTVEVDRTPISLQIGDELCVCQPVGSRLIPGTEVSQPVLSYFLVHIHHPLRDMFSEVRAAERSRVEHLNNPDANGD